MELFGINPRKLVEAVANRAPLPVRRMQRLGRKAVNLGSDQEFGQTLPHQQAIDQIMTDLALSQVEGRDVLEPVAAYIREAERLREIGVDINDLLQEEQKKLIEPYLEPPSEPPPD